MPRFTTTMSQFGNNTGIEVPPEVIDELGAGRRPPVAVVVNGYAYRSTVGVMAGRTLIPFSADRRRETGIGGGDAITVELELDAAPREIAVPDDLVQALEAAGIRSAFDALAPSRRGAHVTTVEGAKTADTRARRVAGVVAALQV